MWFTILKFLKPLIPYILAVLAVFLAYAYIYNKGYNAGKDDGYSKAITETRKMIEKIPPCPKPEPCNGFSIDDKIKGRNITIQNHQHITANMDSLIVNKLLKDIVKAMDERDIVRVKKR